jgi:signal transduction histidine kinase
VLIGLFEDVEQFLNCVTTREWDSPAEHDVGAMVGEIVEQVLRSTEVQGVAASVKLADLPPVYGYERMLRSALEQVIENACNAAADTGKKVQITGREESGGFVRVEVYDNGPGIPVEEREFIYNPFFTSREGRSGLGLSIAQRVVKRLGGRLRLAESEKGTLFILDFPTSLKAPATGENGAAGGDRG